MIPVCRRLSRRVSREYPLRWITVKPRPQDLPQSGQTVGQIDAARFVERHGAGGNLRDEG